MDGVGATGGRLSRGVALYFGDGREQRSGASWGCHEEIGAKRCPGPFPTEPVTAEGGKGSGTLGG